MVDVVLQVGDSVRVVVEEGVFEIFYGVEKLGKNRFTVVRVTADTPDAKESVIYEHKDKHEKTNFVL